MLKIMDKKIFTILLSKFLIYLDLEEVSKLYLHIIAASDFFINQHASFDELRKDKHDT